MYVKKIINLNNTHNDVSRLMKFRPFYRAHKNASNSTYPLPFVVSLSKPVC